MTFNNTTVGRDGAISPEGGVALTPQQSAHGTLKPRNPEKLLSPQQLADFLDTSVWTVYRWNSLGTGPSYFKVGGTVRYDFSDVLGWLDDNRVVRRES